MNDMGAHFGTANFERRKFPRFSVNLPVEYCKVDNSKGRPANTGDVSEGGLLLYVSEPLEIGQELSLKLFFTSERKLSSIQARTQVVWKDIRIGNDGVFRIGVKFVDISSESLTLIKGFLNNLITLKSAKELIQSPRLFPDN
jgi:hypothetical protein